MADQNATGGAGNYDGINFNQPLTVQDINHAGGDSLTLSLWRNGGIDAAQVMNYLRAGSPILFCPPDAVQYLTGKNPPGGSYAGIDFTRPFMVDEVNHTGDRVALRVTIPQGVDWNQARTYLKDGAQILAVPPDAVHMLTQGRTTAAAGGGNI